MSWVAFLLRCDPTAFDSTVDVALDGQIPGQGRPSIIREEKQKIIEKLSHLFTQNSINMEQRLIECNEEEVASWPREVNDRICCIVKKKQNDRNWLDEAMKNWFLISDDRSSLLSRRRWLVRSLTSECDKKYWIFLENSGLKIYWESFEEIEEH